jgi:hypothetical protein
MILNKFSIPLLSRKVKALSIQVLAVSLFSCNKTANVNANKAFVGLTHVAYGVGPLMLNLNGTPLLSVPDSFGQTSGTTGNPYDTTTSRITDMQIIQGSIPLLQGNSAFQQGGRYSIFVYDSLDQRSFSLIIFQDNASIRIDTITNIRFLNFSPGPIARGIKLINTRKDIPYLADTILIGPGLFVGYDINPSDYRFTQVRIGKYDVFAFMDSSNPRMDSLNPGLDSSNFFHLGPLEIDSTINYNIYLLGFYGDSTSVNKFQLKSVPLN